jgi:hypothetical protein
MPRMGKRADAILLSGRIVFVLEYKVGADEYLPDAADQAMDYAPDLKHFHTGSHSRQAKLKKKKAICFVTGVPGSVKTLFLLITQSSRPNGLPQTNSPETHQLNARFGV